MTVYLRPQGAIATCPARRSGGVGAGEGQTHYGEPCKRSGLARGAGLSLVQLERHIGHLFGLSPRQLLLQTRLEAATRLLASPDRVATIAAACGYAVQSAFCRQLRAMVGLTPTQYRALRLSP